MAADQTLALDNAGAHGYVGGSWEVSLGTAIGIPLTLAAMMLPGGSSDGGGGSGPSQRPSNGFLYPRGGC